MTHSTTTGNAFETLHTQALELRNVLAGDAAARDRERRYAHAEFAQLRRSGLLAARVPREYGGPELPPSQVAELLLLIAQGDPNVAQSLQPHYAFMDSLRMDARPSQRDKLYAAVVSGQLFANAFAERGGRFIGDIATTIVPDGAGWRLNGTKYYCTGSMYAQQIYVTGATAEGGRATAVISVDQPGVTLLDDWDAAGQRTTGSGTVRLSDVSVADADVIQLELFGRRSYRGAVAQLLHAAIDAGIAASALDDALNYARTTARTLPESGVAATQDPYVLHAAGEMSVLATQAHAMIREAGRAVDEAVEEFHARRSGEVAADRILAQASIAVARARATTDEASLRVGEFAFRLGGASATSRDRNLDRHWRNARTHTTHDPIAYKYRAIGDYLLNDTFPPITTKI